MVIDVMLTKSVICKGICIFYFLFLCTYQLILNFLPPVRLVFHSHVCLAVCPEGLADFCKWHFACFFINGLPIGCNQWKVWAYNWMVGEESALMFDFFLPWHQICDSDYNSCRVAVFSSFGLWLNGCNSLSFLLCLVCLTFPVHTSESSPFMKSLCLNHLYLNSIFYQVCD